MYSVYRTSGDHRSAHLTHHKVSTQSMSPVSEEWLFFFFLTTRLASVLTSPASQSAFKSQRPCQHDPLAITTSRGQHNTQHTPTREVSGALNPETHKTLTRGSHRPSTGQKSPADARPSLAEKTTHTKSYVNIKQETERATNNSLQNRFLNEDFFRFKPDLHHHPFQFQFHYRRPCHCYRHPGTSFAPLLVHFRPSLRCEACAFGGHRDRERVRTPLVLSRC